MSSEKSNLKMPDAVGIEVSAPYKVIRPNWREWAAKPYWSLDESTALLCNVDPIFVFKLPDEALHYLNQVKLAIVSLIDLDLMSHAVRPIHLIKLWEMKAPHGAPLELKRAVYEFDEDPEKSYGALARKCGLLEKEVAKLKQELKGKEPLDPREKLTLQSLALSMAIEHYSFNPEGRRNNAVNDILVTLRKHGCTRQYDSVRSNLKTAADDIGYEFPEVISIKP
jgi:hypothetical protein